MEPIMGSRSREPFQDTRNLWDWWFQRCECSHTLKMPEFLSCDARLPQNSTQWLVSSYVIITRAHHVHAVMKILWLIQRLFQQQPRSLRIHTPLFTWPNMSTILFSFEIGPKIGLLKNSHFSFWAINQQTNLDIHLFVSHVSIYFLPTYKPKMGQGRWVNRQMRGASIWVKFPGSKSYILSLHRWWVPGHWQDSIPHSLYKQQHSKNTICIRIPNVLSQPNASDC